MGPGIITCRFINPVLHCYGLVITIRLAWADFIMCIGGIVCMNLSMCPEKSGNRSEKN